MSDDKKNDEVLLLDHDYDGIKEYDNPLPRWWLFTFYITIVFAPIYVYYYHFGPGLSLSEELDQNLVKIEAQENLTQEQTKKLSEADLLALINDKQVINEGRALYNKNCLACHGAFGEGLIGPNLTDNYWVHGDGSLKSVLLVISTGVIDKGMPEWGKILSPKDLQNTTVFVRSLLGTNPKNAKTHEGTLIE